MKYKMFGKGKNKVMVDVSKIGMAYIRKGLDEDEKNREKYRVLVWLDNNVATLAMYDDAKEAEKYLENLMSELNGGFLND